MLLSRDACSNGGESVIVPVIRVESESVWSGQEQEKSSISKNKNRTKNRKGERKMTSIAEGQRIDVEATTNATASSSLELTESGCAQGSLATVTHSTMERAIIGTSYNSDYDDNESIASDSEHDHTDSSDDDDPKSQVDRLIEKGTLLYIEDVNSAVSSEGETDDDSSDYDSDSDITDVSPILSARASPLSLSPVMQRRILPPSPLVLNENTDLPFDYRDNRRARRRPESPCFLPRSQCDNIGNMDLLMKTVLEIEKSHQNNNKSEKDEDVFIDPIRANPHHRHLRKTNRKNMSFSNEDVRNIDRTNKILLKKIMAVHTRTKSNLHPDSSYEPSYPSYTSYNKRKEDERIRRANLIMLRKIQDARPSNQVVVRRSLSGPTVS